MTSAAGRPRLAWLGIFLIACALLRIGVFVVHEPLIGLANNYDMVRVQACIDAWPVRDQSVHFAALSWEAPLPVYQLTEPRGIECLAGTESWLAQAYRPLLGWLAKNPDSTFELRAVARIKAGLFMAMIIVAAALVGRTRREGGALTVLGACCLAVVSDPGVTLFLAGFYGEYSAALFGLAACFAIWYALSSARPPSTGAVVFTSIALLIFLTCAAKIQHGAFGLVLLAALLLAVRNRPVRSWIPIAAAVGIGATLGLAFQLINMSSPLTAGIARANATNTVQLALLGNSSDPAHTAARLALPAGCIAAAGKSWLALKADGSPVCSEAGNFRRSQLPGLLVSEPQTLVRAWWSGATQAGRWITPVLGKVEGSYSPELPRNIATVDRLLAGIPRPMFPVLLLAPMLMAVAMLRRRNGHLPRIDQAAAFVLWFCAMFPAVSITIVVFGDGGADVVKQQHLGMLFWLMFWPVALGCLMQRADVAGASPPSQVSNRPVGKQP